MNVGEPIVDNTRSKAALGTVARHGRSYRLLGRTDAGLIMKWDVRYGVVPHGSGYCVWVANIDLLLAHQVLDVYVASEYAPGSCQYQAILAHEYEHVDVAKRVMRGYEQRIRSALTSLSIPRPGLPLTTRGGGAQCRH